MAYWTLLSGLLSNTHSNDDPIVDFQGVMNRNRVLFFSDVERFVSDCSSRTSVTKVAFTVFDLVLVQQGDSIQYHLWRSERFDIVANKERVSCVVMWYCFGEADLRLSNEVWSRTTFPNSKQTKLHLTLIAFFCEHIYFAHWNVQFGRLRSAALHPEPWEWRRKSF